MTNREKRYYRKMGIDPATIGPEMVEVSYTLHPDGTPVLPDDVGEHMIVRCAMTLDHVLHRRFTGRVEVSRAVWDRAMDETIMWSVKMLKGDGV